MRTALMVLTLLAFNLVKAQEFDERLTSFEIDKEIALAGGNARAMAKESLKRQKAWGKERRQEGKLPKELKMFKIAQVIVSNAEKDGYQVTQFNSIFYHRSLGIAGGYYKEMNQIPVKKLEASEDKTDIGSAELALKRIEEAKKMLDLKIISQKEYDSIFNINSKLIREKRINE
jgi:hypothetical protein